MAVEVGMFFPMINNLFYRTAHYSKPVTRDGWSLYFRVNLTFGSALFRMECLEFHEFFNRLVGLPVIIKIQDRDISDKWKFFLYGIYQRFTEIIVFLGVLGQFFAVPVVWDDMNILCGCLASGTHSLQVLFKTALLKCYRRNLIQFLVQIDSVEKCIENFRIKYLHSKTAFGEYHAKQSNYVRQILRIHFAITFLSTSAYFLPFVYDSIIHWDQVSRQLTPIVIYLAFDFNWTPVFQIVVILLTICFYVNNLKAVVIDNFVLGLITLNVSHYRFQRKLLRIAITKYYTENRVLEEENCGAQNERKNQMKEWIVANQKLLQSTSYFEKLTSPYFLIEFAYILIHTCVPAFVITSTFSWTVPQKMAVFFIVGGGLIELLFMSRAGDAVTGAWETLDDDLFNPRLYRKEQKWMFNFFMMTRIRRASPFRLRAFKTVPLACSTFGTILRLIVSHYMTLNQIQTMKNGRN